METEDIKAVTPATAGQAAALIQLVGLVIAHHPERARLAEAIGTHMLQWMSRLDIPSTDTQRRFHANYQEVLREALRIAKSG